MRAIAAAALVVTGSFAALAFRADAEEPAPSRPPALAWTAPIACPAESLVQAHVAALLAGSTAPVAARAEVHRVGERWQVVVVMNGGERRLDADSCYALAEATALIVAMAVDPARVAANRLAAVDAGPFTLPDASDAPDAALPDAAPEPPDALAPAPPPTANPALTPPPTSPPIPTRTSTPPHFSASAAVSLDVGTLPSPTFAPSLSFAWLPGPLRLDLTASFFPSSTLPITSAASSGTAHFWLFDAALRACYLLRPGSFEIGPCAGAQVGLLQGYSLGINSTASGSSPLFALDAGLFGAWHFASAWAIFARGDAGFQTNHQGFAVTAGNDVALSFTPSSVTERASLGLELRF